jgi:hypothetical protein
VRHACVVASDCCVVDVDEGVIVVCAAACVEASDCLVVATDKGFIMCAWPLV